MREKGNAGLLRTRRDQRQQVSHLELPLGRERHLHMHDRALPEPRAEDGELVFERKPGVEAEYIRSNGRGIDTPAKAWLAPLGSANFHLQASR